MGGTKSKPEPSPPPPSPPPKIYTYSSSPSSYNFTYQNRSSQSSSTAFSSSTSSYSSTSPQASYKVPHSTASSSSSSFRTSNRTDTKNDVKVIEANVSVAHPANSYKIPNITVNSDVRPNFTLQLNNQFDRRNNLRIDRYVMSTCPQHLNRKGCYIRYCFRFHVCQFWVKGSCRSDSCQYDHGFNGNTNKDLFDVLHFGEPQLLGVLKRNMFKGKELVKEERHAIICIDFILNRCKKENCKFYHSKSSYVWQVNVNNKWIDFPHILNDKVENLFTAPSNTKCSTSFRKTGGKNTPWVNSVFLSISLELDFENMTLTSKGAKYQIQRLSTDSDAKKLVGPATRWLWYWKDDHGIWNFYTNAIIIDTGMAVIPFSDYLETEYLKKNDVVNFKFSNNFTYKLDFSSMTQTNQSTLKVRTVRRRPMPSKKKSTWNDNTTIKSLWSITSNSSEQFIKVTVAPLSPEFLYFKNMMEKTLSLKYFSLERIENEYLWKIYQVKKSQMLEAYANNADAISEQFLFHGTSKSVVDKICAQNLDWRLYGTRVGNIYGKGTYFSSSAALSNNYAASDETGIRWMFIILVLVGKACVGNGNIVLPPSNPTTKRRFDTTVESAINPTIFVKYNLDDYYPAYIVKYN